MAFCKLFRATRINILKNASSLILRNTRQLLSYEFPNNQSSECCSACVPWSLCCNLCMFSQLSPFYHCLPINFNKKFNRDNMVLASESRKFEYLFCILALISRKTLHVKSTVSLPAKSLNLVSYDCSQWAILIHVTGLLI